MGEDRQKFWFQEFPMKYYLSELRSESINQVNVLSPITDFVLSCVNTALKNKKNFFFAIPHENFNPILIIAWRAAKLLGGNVIVFSERSEDLFKEYVRLSDLEGNWLFDTVPAAIFRDNQLIIRDFYPFAKRSYKKYIEKTAIQKTQKKPDIKEIVLKRLKDQNFPSIFFADIRKELRSFFKIMSLSIDDREERVALDIMANGVLFEGINSFCFSERIVENFSEWLLSTDRTKNKRWYFFHFNDPYDKKNQLFISKFNLVGIHLGTSIMRNNKTINEGSEDYFRKNDGGFKDFPNLLNCDLPCFYKQKYEIEIIRLPKGNIDVHFQNAMNLNKKISKFSDNPSFLDYAKLRTVLFHIQSIFLNPSTYKVNFQSKSGWRHYDPLDLITKFWEKLQQSEDNLLMIYYHSFCSELYSIYSELCDTHRVNEKYSYEKRSKLEILTSILLNKKRSETIIVGCIDAFERDRIRQLLNCEKETSFQVKSMGDLCRGNIYENAHLIVAGRPTNNFFSIFMKPWNKITFITFDGRNAVRIEALKEALSGLIDGDEENSFNYLEEMRIALKLNENLPLFQKYRQSLLEKAEKLQNLGVANAELPVSEKLPKQLVKVSVKNPIEQLKDLIKNYSKDSEDEEALIKETEELIERTMKETEDRESDSETKRLYFEAENHMTKAREKICLYDSVPYIFIRIGDESSATSFKVEEDYADNLTSNDYGNIFVLYFKELGRKGMVGLISELGKLEEEIDEALFDVWKGTLKEGKKRFSSIKEFYDIFKKNVSDPVHYSEFCSWCRGGVNYYTQNPEHIKILGKILNNAFLQENYKTIYYQGKKIQKIHMQVSRKIEKIVGSILKNTPSDMNYEDQQILEYIRPYIYLIKGMASFLI